MNEESQLNSSKFPDQSIHGIKIRDSDAVIVGPSKFGSMSMNEIKIIDSEGTTIVQKQIIQISVDEIKTRKFIKDSPYKGLKKFESGDKDLFFGRENLLAELVADLEKHSLILLLGASGSGKSSVVRAGILPWFTRKYGAKSILTFTPGQNPFESLYACLLTNEYSMDKIEFVRQNKTDTFLKIVRELNPKNSNWLIFIDQFEQLFTSHVLDIEQRNNFIESLLQVANLEDNSLKIMLAMRADFLEQLSSYPALGAIVNKNNIHLVTDMHPDELRQAIEQPAANHGVVFEEGLVQQIIKEVEGQKGYLPLLQYTLDLLWQIECKTVGADGHYKIENRTLNKSSYAALEGVRGALQKRVNDIYNNLKQNEQSATKQIFAKLVNIVETEFGTKIVSRRANRNEFEGELVNETLKTFIDENLLVSSSEKLSLEKLNFSSRESIRQSATIEIAHEILLSSWKQLKSWIEEEKRAILLKNFLSDETRRWQKILSKDESKANDELLKGSRLEDIIQFRQKKLFDKIGGLNKQEEKFINTSVEWNKILHKKVLRGEKTDKEIDKEIDKKIKEFKKDKGALYLTLGKVVLNLFLGSGLVMLLFPEAGDWLEKFSCQFRDGYKYNQLTHSCEIDYNSFGNDRNLKDPLLDFFKKEHKQKDQFPDF